MDTVLIVKNRNRKMKKRLIFQPGGPMPPTSSSSSLPETDTKTDGLCLRLGNSGIFPGERSPSRVTQRCNPSLVGTVADHRMTNNNRIRLKRKLYHDIVSIPVLVLCILVALINGHPDPEPIRVSNSYTKAASNFNYNSSKIIPAATSTTSRSTTSFLPSDAISFLSLPSPIKKPSSLSSSPKTVSSFSSSSSTPPSSSSTTSISTYSTSVKTFKPLSRTSNSSSSSSSSSLISSYNKNFPNSNSTIFNANRRSDDESVGRRRKDSSLMSHQQMTSIDRPFYTKITSHDAVPNKPTLYKNDKGKSRRPSSSSSKKSNHSKKSSKHNKYSKGKGGKRGSKEQDSSYSNEDMDYALLMPQTTEKSYHPPKLSLEPFFNFLTSLATASREVILSKEQGSHQQQTTEQPQHQSTYSGSITTGGSNKYSPSYETINQSIREGAKKSKKSKKKGKKHKGKSRPSSSKESSSYGKKGTTKGYRSSKESKRPKFKGSIEELSSDSEDEEIELVNSHEFRKDEVTESPKQVPPPPNPIVDSAEHEENEEENENAEDNDNDGDRGSNAPGNISPSNDEEEEEENVLEKPNGLHILDVLRTPMIPDYESPPMSRPQNVPPTKPKLETFSPSPSDYHQHGRHPPPIGPSNNFVASSSTNGNGMDDMNAASSSIHKNVVQIAGNQSSTSSTSFTTNPPSGRANANTNTNNNNKGQGYLAFDKFEGSPGMNNNHTSGFSPTNPKYQQYHRENQQRERDQVSMTMSSSDTVNTYEQPKYPIPNANSDLQAQESVTHAQILIPNHYGPGPTSDPSSPSAYSYQYQSQYHQNKQQKKPKSNDLDFISPPSKPDESVEIPKASGSSQSDVIYGQHQGQNEDLVSKYPTTFVFQPNGGSPGRPGSMPPSGLPSPPPPPPGSRPFHVGPSPSGMPPGPPPPPPPGMYSLSPPPSSRSPFRLKKLRPNLHSYYDASYHKFTAAGETQLVPSEMIGIRHPYGPPHFRPPFRGPPPPPSPPRFRPPLMMGPPPNRGTHYAGHSMFDMNSKEPMTKPYEGKIMNSNLNADYHEQDLSGNGHNNNNNNNNNNGDSDLGPSGPDTSPSGPDSIDQFSGGSGGENEDNSIAEQSETKKVGIMDQFDLFYKEYKVLTWVAVFFVTSLCLLTLLVYLYVNNPPTEVVQARQFPWNDLMKNPQIIKFLSSILESGKGSWRSDSEQEEFIKPYGNGFGSKSGRQKRKQTRSQQDKDKLARRVNRGNVIISSANKNSSTTTTTTKTPEKRSNNPNQLLTGKSSGVSKNASK